MEGTKRDCPSVRRRSKGGYLLVFLVALAAALVAAGSSLTEAKVQKAQKTTSDRLYVENRGCEVMELNPLRTEEYPEITEAVREYYRQQGEEASFAESYDDIHIYTKEGRYRGTYVVFVAYDMKIKDIYTKVPGLGTVYVEDDEEGGCRIIADVKDQEIKEYIQMVSQHEDVQKLMTKTQKAYQEAVRSDALLQEALLDLKNAYENSTGS